MSDSSSSEVADAGQESVASIYAKALLATTEKSGASASVLQELDAVVNDVLGGQPKFSSALASPRLSVEDKLRMIDNVFGGRVSSELLRFLKVLARHERLGALRDINRAFRRLYNEAHGRVEVSVTTAETLRTEQQSEVKQALQAKLGRQIDLVTHTDPNVLGGIVVRMGDTVYDASLAYKKVNFP